MQGGYPVRVDRRVFVPMEDGVRLALTVYLPDAPADGPFPAVVESLPYRKDDDCTGRDWQTYSSLAAAGIAGIRVDIRGTGASTGIIEDEYVEQEQQDTLAVLTWAAAQEWCTGRLGMWGISWGGFSALQTAMLQPPELEAIVAMHATHDRYACDVHYLGGSLHAAEQADWPGSMIACNALPPDPDIVGEAWFDEWMQRLDRTPQWPFEWLRHQERDDYWLHGSPCAEYESIAAPTLLIGGWLDPYVDGMISLAENLTCPNRLLVGPWGHHRPATGQPGPTLDHFDLLSRWFGHHLRDDNNGIMDELAAATIFVSSEPSNDTTRIDGYWRSEPVWPPPNRTDQKWSLGDLAPSSTSWSGPQWTGSHAPAWDRSGVVVGDSTEDDRESMTFETPVLAEPIEILGTPVVDVMVRSDRSVGMVAARLIAIAPDGSTRLVSRGNRNLAFASDLSTPSEPAPHTDTRLVFPLVSCSSVIPAGWRLRLALSGADFPVVWPPGQRFELEIDPTSSKLILPTVPPRSADRRLDIPEADEPPATTTESLSGTDERSVEHTDGDIGGHTTYRRHVAHRELQPTRGDLTYGMDQWWTVEVDDEDPASTTVATTCLMSLQREDWTVSATGSMRIVDTDGSFDVTIDLVAEHDGATVFQRRWNEQIPRRWV